MLLALLLAVAPAGAAPSDPHPAPPASAQAVDPHFFDYDARAPFSTTVTPLRTEAGGVRVFTVTFPSPVTTPFPANNTVTGYLFLPPGPGPHPAVIVFHEWLPVNLNNEFGMCQGIVKAGAAAFLLVQPYSLNRRPTPHTPDAELLSGNVPQMVAGLRQSILEARRGLDYLATRPDIDMHRLGSSGISLGGILAPLLAGADSRVSVVLTIVGGGNIADIVWNSFFTRGLKPEMKRRGYTRESLTAAMAPLEAANWLHGFNPENALLFNGRYDVFVRPHQAEHLAEALGGAHIVWANTGHYGLALIEPKVLETGGAWLHSRFFPSAAPAAALPDTLPSRTLKLGFLLGGHEGLSPAIAYQLFDFDRAGRYSLDGQLTLHGVALAPSALLLQNFSVGLELPLLHGPIKPKPFLLVSFTL